MSNGLLQEAIITQTSRCITAIIGEGKKKKEENYVTFFFFFFKDMRYWLPYLPCCTYMTREGRRPLIMSLSENRSLLYLTGPRVNRGLFIIEEEYCEFFFFL